MNRPTHSRQRLRRVVTSALLAIGLVSSAVLTAAPSYAAADDGPIVPASIPVSLDCDASPRGITLDVILEQGYEEPTGQTRLQIAVNTVNAVDEWVTYPGTHTYFIPLEADGRYLYSVKIGRGSWTPNEEVNLPQDCETDPTPSPTPTATPSPTETPVPTSTPEPTPSATPTPAPAPSDEGGSASASLSSSTVTPGSTVTVSGRGYVPGEAIDIWLYSTPVKLWSGTASADGTFSRTVTIPDTTTPGNHHIEIRATSGSTSLDLTVVAGLAVTGTSSGSVIGGTGLAALLAASGVSLMLWRRRSSTV